MNVAETLVAHARRRPEAVALRADRATITYGAFWRRVRKLAHGFRQLGLQHGAHVVLLSPNRIEGLEVIFAAALADVVSVPLNHRLGRGEIVAIVADCQPAVAVVEETLAALLPPSLKQITFSSGRYGGTSDYERLIGDSSDRALRGVSGGPGSHAAQIKYTSGTSDEPKGAVISHRARTSGFLYRIVEFGFRQEDVFLLPGPLYGGFGTLAMLALYLGATVVLPRDFSSREVMAELMAAEVTVCLLVPTMYEKIFQECPPDPSRLRSVRMMLSATAPLHARTRARILGDFGPILHEFYGTTEAGVVTHARPEDHLQRTGTIGLPLLGVRVRLVDDDGKDAHPGAGGELCVSGPDMFDGYLGRAAETGEVLRDGWYFSGDIARADEQGYLYLVDRKKETVISGGQNIYPLEIERVLFTHPAVLDAAVIGVPDQTWGESLVAVVVRRPGVDVTAEQLIAHCGEHLAAFKKPRAVRFVAELPKEPGGKVQRRVLRAALADTICGKDSS